MNQTTFTDVEYAQRKKFTKREEFLDMMEEIIPLRKNRAIAPVQRAIAFLWRA